VTKSVLERINSDRCHINISYRIVLFCVILPYFRQYFAMFRATREDPGATPEYKYGVQSIAISVSVCFLSVCPLVYSKNRTSTFHYIFCGGGSVLLWRHYNTLFRPTFGFMDDVIFSYNWSNRQRVCFVSSPGGRTGDEVCAVADCVLFYNRMRPPRWNIAGTCLLAHPWSLR